MIFMVALYQIFNLNKDMSNIIRLQNYSSRQNKLNEINNPKPFATPRKSLKCDKKI